jgi:3-keto-disaccharide hydrolase/trehalose utilization protein
MNMPEENVILFNGEPVMRTKGIVIQCLILIVLYSWNVGTIQAAKTEFKPIFDGKSLAGWDGDKKFWRVEDGNIIGQTTKENPTKSNTFLIWQYGEVDDFELKFKYRIRSEWANSGVQYRSQHLGNYVVKGYQGDIESGENYTGILYEERGRGILALRGAKMLLSADKKKKEVGRTGDTKQLQTHIRKNNWNEYHIIARGNHITQTINGQVMCEVTDQSKTDARRSGILALQLHQGEPMTIEFKDILLKRLGMKDKKKIVMIGGAPSHGYDTHEHNAGYLLLAGSLNKHIPNIHAVVYRNGWPKDPTALDNADAITINCDGGNNHILIPHLEEVDKLMKQGVGIGIIHYALIVPKGKPGNSLLNWIGGYHEEYWSVNPIWEADFKTLPKHPVTRGVKPFKIKDEWYYHMRFVKDMANVTPILTAIPPDETRRRKDGPHSGNEHVRARMGMPEHVAWVYERPGGGRGFGFTGTHWHTNWANDDFRTIVLNGLVWIAGVEVPPKGVPSKTPTQQELEANQDYPKKTGN